MKSKKINFLMIITIIAILLDQLIKIIIKSKIFNSSIILIPHVLNLTYVQNTGAAFGIGSNSTSMFVAVNVVYKGKQAISSPRKWYGWSLHIGCSCFQYGGTVDRKRLAGHNIPVLPYQSSLP